VMETTLCFIKKRIQQLEKERPHHNKPKKKCTCMTCVKKNYAIEELKRLEDVMLSEIQGHSIAIR